MDDMTIGALLLEWLGWFFELSSSLAPFIATAGAAFILLRVFQRKWRWAALWTLVAGTFGVLWFFSIAEALPMRQDGAHPLTVVTANLYGANGNYDAGFEWARSSNADVIVFQEVTSGWGRALDALNQTYIASTSTTGIRVYARYPITNRQSIPTAQGGLDALQFVLRAPGGDITFVAVHLVSPQTAEDLAVRNDQLRALARHMRELDGDAVLLGDLNTAATTTSFLRLLDEGRLSHPQVHAFFGTWPTDLPFGLFQIDHVLVRGRLGYSSVTTEDVPGSDHFGLRAELVRLPE